MNSTNSCPICNQSIQEEQARFYFPKLPDWHALSRYLGTVHVDCLRALPNGEEVSKPLADICESLYGKESETPVVARERNLVVKDCLKNCGCFEIYDFDDFAEFFIPVHATEAVRQLEPNQFLSLGVQGLQVLHRSVDGKLSLERTKPHFVVDLPEMTYEVLVSCLSRAQKAATFS
ncbi:hypothetical protein HAV22_15600 [Massilia sp. TW-1]|uniref:Uncharacterized protein n=1 Tax=Telluria antibiotica TaxID=2717319 RepID=A0ABX0PDW5_9BURK|nr:hypothetical protein [Telluria antibiotica]NIA55061.1 hypothetical protein [Telluria antibiotica]